MSLLLGVGTALVSMFRSKSTASFAVTVAVLPVVVQTVIMLVNGNLGAGVAVAGAFGLVRFGERNAQERILRITLKGTAAPKAFLDAVRCRNGNLNVSCGRENRSESL